MIGQEWFYIQQSGGRRSTELITYEIKTARVIGETMAGRREASMLAT